MRFCHSCDCQYPDEMEVCFVCDGPLRDVPREGGSSDAAGWSPEQWAVVAQVTPFDAARLLDALVEESIPFALAPHDDRRLAALVRSGAARPGALWVLVPRREHPRAFAIEQRLLVESLPDLPEGFDPHAFDASRCPACETPMEPDAIRCEECGLEIPEAGS